MDVGDSLNPAVDIGQIEGAFVQGYGLFTMEELRVRGDGTRLTRGPGTYKIPSADDAPRQFHVKLLTGSSNKSGIFSSKVCCNFMHTLCMQICAKSFHRLSASRHSSLARPPSLPSARQFAPTELSMGSPAISAWIRRPRPNAFGWHARMPSSKRCTSKTGI
jgi:hypothetical protein